MNLSKLEINKKYLVTEKLDNRNRNMERVLI